MNKCFVYGLKDPISNEIRYVGMTTVGNRRPNAHLSPKLYNHPDKKHFHVYNWIRSLIEQNLKPEIVVLEYSTKEDIYNLEQVYIQKYREIGYNLCNHTDGGKGMLGLKHSEATKEKFSRVFTGRKLSDETRLKMSKRMIENHPLQGKHHTEDSKQKMRLAHIGKKLTEEHKIKIGKSNKGIKKPISLEHRQKLHEMRMKNVKSIICVETGNIYESVRDASRKTGLERTGIMRVLNGLKSQYKGFTFKFLGGYNNE